jgi:hypothetical protein
MWYGLAAVRLVAHRHESFGCRRRVCPPHAVEQSQATVLPAPTPRPQRLSGVVRQVADHMGGAPRSRPRLSIPADRMIIGVHGGPGRLDRGPVAVATNERVLTGPARHTPTGVCGRHRTSGFWCHAGRATGEA